MTERYADKSHILIVDDDQRIRSLAARYLRREDFIVLEAQDAAAARGILAQFECDAMVVDIMMPGETGLDFVRDMRKNAADNDAIMPVLFLTALGAVEDRIAGLEAGADDYLAKPFEPKELVLRLQSILRRAPKPEVKMLRYQIGDWVFDVQNNSIRHDGIVQALTTGEANLLKALLKRPREVMSREDLSNLCGLDAGERTIDVQVTRLRRKIEKDSKNPYYLQTVRGKGYVLMAQELPS